MNEHALLQSIYAQSTQNPKVSIGPGDDMGELLIGNERILCAVDQLIVGRHVKPETSPELIGRKAIARCFSDIAAMCATPIGCLMTACVPPETTNKWCEAVFLSAKKAAQQWGGPIFGGDIASSEGPAVFTVTAIATPVTSESTVSSDTGNSKQTIHSAVKRSGAQAGDYLCVTGELGNSVAGHHLEFTPRIKEAQALLEILGENLHAMIDISDGLGQDASHLSSDVLQIVIDTALLPLRDGATITAAIEDGEDYELLFATATKPPAHLATVIGVIEAGNNKVITTDGENISTRGWNHE